MERELEDRFESTAVRVSTVSIIGNAVLSLLKALAGVFAHSGAMISDAVHSASDVFSSVIVIIGVKIASKDSDRDHPYGHERFECVAAVVLSVVLFMIGLFIGRAALGQIFSSDSEQIAIPGVLALAAAAISIASKEAMYRYARYYAKRLDSAALMADAWHHRSDALSSIGALVGIAGARLGYPILDPVAGLVICGFIFKAAYDIFKDAMDKMVDRSCCEEMERALKDCAAEQPGVLGVDLIHTRIFGNKIYVDIEIVADGRITLSESHDVAEQVHAAIEERFTKVKHIMVHVNPAQEREMDEKRNAPRKKRVAFICVHNSCRSQIAEALGKRLASDVFESYSAGTELKPQINQDAVRIMKTLYGIDMEADGQRSKLYQEIPEPDVAISMGCDVACPFVGRPFDANWGLADPTGKSDDEFKAIVSEIEKNVLALKKSLSEN